MFSNAKKVTAKAEKLTLRFNYLLLRTKRKDNKIHFSTRCMRKDKNREIKRASVSVLRSLQDFPHRRPNRFFFLLDEHEPQEEDGKPSPLTKSSSHLFLFYFFGTIDISSRTWPVCANSISPTGMWCGLGLCWRMVGIGMIGSFLCCGG